MAHRDTTGRVYEATAGRLTYGIDVGIILMDDNIPHPPGTPSNARTFNYPVVYDFVTGATMQSLIYDADPALYEPFRDAALRLKTRGVAMITGNCGFMIQFQERLRQDTGLPCMMSSLLQLPFVRSIIGPERAIAIITSSARSLRREYLTAAFGETPPGPLVIGDMEPRPHFNESVHAQTEPMDIAKLQQEVIDVAEDLLRTDASVGAILLECTDLPPFSAGLRAATGLPVFDWSTMVDYAHQGVAHVGFGM